MCNCNAARMRYVTYMEDKETRMKQSEAMKKKVLIQEEITALSNKKIKL